MAFGYKQLLHEPIMGGGIWTALALTLVYEWGWKPVFSISLLMMIVWTACAVYIARRKNS
jgi:ESS family glutamate:Na+ symporter